MYKVLVDSNIFVDFMLHRMPFYDDSEKVISLCENKRIKGYITTSELMDLHYIYKKFSHSNETSNAAIKEIMNVFNVLDINEGDILKSIEQEHRDFEDCVVENCSNRNKIDYIVTRNPKDFIEKKTKIIEPHALLNIV